MAAVESWKKGWRKDSFECALAYLNGVPGVPVLTYARVCGALEIRGGWLFPLNSNAS